MGRAPYCEKVELKKGRWTPEEDERLIKYIQDYGEGSWKSLPKIAGLSRCGKSCRLRWINYLRDDLKRGNISVEEDEMIVRLHEVFGSRWSIIASHLPGRTDNEIKNHWKTRLSRQLYRFIRNTNEETQISIDIATVVKPKKQRVGRVSRSVAKKYNKHRVVEDNKSPPSRKLVDRLVLDQDVGFRDDDELELNCLEFQDDLNELGSDPIKFQDVNEHVWNLFQADELEPSTLLFQDDHELGLNTFEIQDDELIDIKQFLDNEAIDSSVNLSKYDMDQMETLSAESDVVKNNERNAYDSNLSSNSSTTMELCFDDNDTDMDFGHKGFNICLEFQDEFNELGSDPIEFQDVVNELVWNQFQADELQPSTLLFQDDHELRLNTLEIQDDELIDIEQFLDNEAIESSVDLSKYGMDQMEKLFAESDVVKNNERNAYDSNLSLNFSATMELCFDENDTDMDFSPKECNICDEKDDRFVWPWEDVNS